MKHSCSCYIHQVTSAVPECYFSSHTGCRWGGGQAAGWWHQCRGKLSISNLWCPSHTSLVLLSLMDCSCGAGSSEGCQRLLIFSWQPQRQERWPSPSHLPGSGRAADSYTVLSDTHSKTPATNFSRFFPQSPILTPCQLASPLAD